MSITEAKRLENESKWAEAARMWRELGMKEDAEAAQFIHDSIRKADRYREIIRGASKDFEDRKINVFEYQEIMRSAMERAYGK